MLAFLVHETFDAVVCPSTAPIRFFVIFFMQQLFNGRCCLYRLGLVTKFFCHFLSLCMALKRNPTCFCFWEYEWNHWLLFIFVFVLRFMFILCCWGAQYPFVFNPFNPFSLIWIKNRKKKKIVDSFGNIFRTIFCFLTKKKKAKTLTNNSKHKIMIKFSKLLSHLYHN